MLLPTTSEEISKLSWDRPDVILVTGDAYIDSPHIGVAVIGRVLADAGYRVGIIAQPDTERDIDIQRLGEPRLFWGITGGCMDSMVANYTALKKRRREDDLTPGGRNNRRPDRAVIAYANLIRRYFKNTRPIVLGGVEASMRRIAHYDYWSDTIRRAILFDARADVLAYGMAERSVLEIAQRLAQGKDLKNIRGTCVIENDPPRGYLELPSCEKAAADPKAFVRCSKFLRAKTTRLRHRVTRNTATASGASSAAASSDHGRTGCRLQPGFSRHVHPFTKSRKVRAMDTISFFIDDAPGLLRGMPFLFHRSARRRGRFSSRSEESILAEAGKLRPIGLFKGIYRGCRRSDGQHVRNRLLSSNAVRCPDKRCLYPRVCSSTTGSHASDQAACGPSPDSGRQKVLSLRVFVMT